ncbi:MAG: hypothetical protein J7623_16560 [Chitinophaga sp.]|uniref:hypothetical protein n=1 Tax=Chitinophaga sp. TaxID=1869181 RepID=UPI001B1A62A8|nr:hypothetical protein [Chitinophaga sp.]MBO9730254.1 hypothetical protein [Chitinophaga sp.]
MCGKVANAQSPGPEHVNVDGNLAEWGKSLRNYDKSAVLWYDIHNDADFLYIAFKRPSLGWNIALPKRLVIEISEPNKPGVQIVYPGHYSDNKDEMWNHLEIKRMGATAFDTMTIYNDLGIQAAGGFWDKKVPAKEVGGAPDEGETAYIVGADGELAIPRKLLPVATGTCTIKMTIGGGESDYMVALNKLNQNAHFDLGRGSGDGLTALIKEFKLSVTYLLK